MVWWNLLSLERGKLEFVAFWLITVFGRLPVADEAGFWPDWVRFW